MNWKELGREYFTFTHKERVGLLVLVTLIVIIWIAPKMLSFSKSRPVPIDTTWISAARTLLHQAATPQGIHDETEEGDNSPVVDRVETNDVSRPPHDLFIFDPNTLSPGAWKKLGIRDKTIATIQKYLSKGGHF